MPKPARLGTQYVAWSPGQTGMRQRNAYWPNNNNNSWNLPLLDLSHRSQSYGVSQADQGAKLQGIAYTRS